MSLKQLVYAATTCRITCYVLLGVFAVAMYMDLTEKVKLMSLGFSYIAFVLSYLFVEFYKNEVTKIVIARTAAAEALAEDAAVKVEEILKDYTEHPVLKEDGDDVA